MAIRIEAVGIALRQGRLFEPADGVARPRVAIVNRTAAAELFGAALGRRDQGERPSPGGPAEGQEVEIAWALSIRVLEPAYVEGATISNRPAIYLPSRLEPEMALTLARSRAQARHVNGAGNPGGGGGHRSARAGRGDSTSRGPPCSTSASPRSASVGARGSHCSDTGRDARLRGPLRAAIVFIVAMRRREIGVRMVLGAEPRRILRADAEAGDDDGFRRLGDRRRDCHRHQRAGAREDDRRGAHGFGALAGTAANPVRGRGARRQPHPRAQRRARRSAGGTQRSKAPPYTLGCRKQSV